MGTDVKVADVLFRSINSIFFFKYNVLNIGVANRQTVFKEALK